MSLLHVPEVQYPTLNSIPLSEGRIRKILDFLKHDLKFKTPYQVLVDARFFYHFYHEKIKLKESLRGFLKRRVTLRTSRCMLKALEREPYITEEVSIAAKKQLQIKRCKHGGGNDLFQCFKSIIEKEPSKSFLVASPCEELWREFDRAPNMRVPTIYWDGSGADFMLRAPEESSPKKEMKAAGSKLRAPEESSPKKEMKAAGSKRKKGKGEGEGSSKKKIKSTKFSGSG